MITPYSGHGRGSHFNWWDHWPVSQVASDGRAATSPDKPSHSSLCHIGLPGMATAQWKDYASGEQWRTKIMLHGLTDKPIDELVPLAKSWLNPAELVVTGSACRSKGYDPTQAAYVLSCDKGPERIQLELKAEVDSPLVCPAFVLENWGNSGVKLTVNGSKAEPGKDFRFGHRDTPNGADLIIWLDKQTDRPVKLSLSPVS